MLYKVPTKKKPLLGLNFDDISNIVSEIGFKTYRAKQIYSSIYQNPVRTIDEITTLSIHDRKILNESYCISTLSYITHLISKKDKKTCKYLFRTFDGYFVETVKIGSQDAGYTLCLSCQVGCPLKCKFCATGKIGFKRNLFIDEILWQVTYIVATEKEKPKNIVFMGMGEPFLNYQNVIKVIKILNSPEGLKIGARRITVSTCGIPKYIRKLSDENMEINLAISLNAANDSVRSYLMPINRKYNISEIMRAVDYYIMKTNRRVTFEYVMIKEVNDSIKDAKDLALLLKDKLCHVNLIPFNGFQGLDFLPSTKERILLFLQILAHSKVNATIRKSKGSDICAACGQLAGKI